MPTIDEKELLQLLEIGREGRNLEYKRSCSWSEPVFKAQITKAILGFSNVRDGGRIVIGLEEQTDKTYKRKGVTHGHLKSYNYDDISSYVSGYADPYVKFYFDGGK
jgi:hypothetical protein